MVQLAEKGDRHTITAVAVRLKHGERHVRLAAVRALTQLAEKGDQHTITAVAAYLEHGEKHVRYAAIEALVELAERVLQIILHHATEDLLGAELVLHLCELLLTFLQPLLQVLHVCTEVVEQRVHGWRQGHWEARREGGRRTADPGRRWLRDANRCGRRTPGGERCSLRTG